MFYKPYPPIYAMLARHGIHQPVRAMPLPDTASEADENEDERTSFDTAPAARAVAKAGLAALEGQAGPTRDALVYGAALCLWHLKRFDSLAAAAYAVRRVLDSGQARARLKT